MARKNKNQDTSLLAEEEKSFGSKVITFFIGLIIILIWLGIFGVLIKLDVNGFGSQTLRPLIKDIPVINRILPDVDDDTLAFENDYPYSSLEEAINRIKELELMNDSLSETTKSDSSRLSDLEAEVARLKVFEENQVIFEERVLNFDKQVVFAETAPTIEEYRAFYEEIDPANAEVIYKQVIEQLQVSESVKEKAEIYRKMKPDNAAVILENMTADIDLVAEMLIAMRPTESSAILAEMNSTNAAKITKKMFDLDAEKLSSLSE